METSINCAHGVLINITGSEDMGLEDVEAAANLVQEAAHPDANIIFGATFDDTLQDEIRVTVIATGFEEKPAEGEQPAEEKKPAAAAPIAPVRPAAKPAGLFSGAAEKAAAAAAVPPPLEEETETDATEDPFDSIFKIFNTK
jgi:cell division protein FtsZ